MTRFWLGPPVVRNGPTFDYFDAPNQSAMLLDLRSVPQCAAATPQGFCVFATPNVVDLGSSYENLGTDPDAPWNAQSKLRWRSALGLPNPVNGSNLRRILWETLTVQSDPIGDDRIKPLDCTVARRFELWFLGNLIDHKRFNATDEEAPPLIDMLKRIYRAARQDSLNGVTPPTHYKKVLGFWIKKYGVPYRMLQPADLPDEPPEEPTTTISDNFNRADQAGLGTASGGFSWTTLDSGAWSIVSNQADTTASGIARADSDLSGADHYAQVTLVDAVTGGHRGTIARKDGTTTLTYYLGDFNTSNWQLFKRVSGTYTSLGSTAGTQAASDVVKTECNGSSIAVYKNGVSQVSATDTSITGNLRCGLSSGNADPLYDDWSAADLAAAGILYTKLERNVRGMMRGMYTGFTS